MKLLDHFTINASNMCYEGLVLEVMGQDTLSILRRSSHGKLSLNNGRGASRQVAMGLEYLHKCGVGHEGLLPGHIALHLFTMDRSSHWKYLLYDIGIERIE